MAGGTFTITNGGVFGSMMGTPIINPPQSAILGMHAIKNRPVCIGDKIEARPIMYVALTYDHRIIDGREAVLFLRKIKECVEDPKVILFDIWERTLNGVVSTWRKKVCLYGRYPLLF